jgi:hypothetical protein
VSAMAVSLIAFIVIFCGALLGAFLRRVLPGHHLAADAKDVVRLGTGLVGTIAALVLGLLIASAKSSYDTQSSEVEHLTADIILLDQLQAQYGPEARPIRELTRRAVPSLVERIWGENGSKTLNKTPFAATSAAEDAFARIGELAPQTEAQRSLKARMIQLSSDLAQTRLALFVQAGSSIPMPFLAVLVFWLTIIFASFSLFSNLNPTLVVVLFVFALSAAGAIYLILELNQPFAGLMQISSAPLRSALAPLGP